MRKSFLFAASVLVLVQADWVASASPAAGTFQRAPCPIPVPAGLAEGQSMLCGYATVPEQHGRPGGPALRLAVAKFPSLSKTPSSDALVLLAGGPGESNFLAFIPGMGSQVGRQFRAKRDVVVIELRGLFYSEPNLLCPERFDALEAELDQDPKNPRAEASDMNAIRKCRERLTSQGVNLSAFTNTETAADIATVMSALGYDTFNLYANSAGTMLAQHVMGAYPNRLRAVALGSTAPLAAPIWPSMPATGTRALQRVFGACATDLACQHAYPALEGTFLSLLDNLNRAPVTLAMQNPTTQKPFQLLLTGDRFSQWIYNLLLNDANAGRSIPFIIGRTAAADYRPLRLGAGLFLRSSSFSQGLQYSVICAEDGGFTPSDISLGGPYRAFAKAVSTLWFGPEKLLAACRIWDVPSRGAQIGKPVTGNMPTLLLSGDFDPATPPSYAHAVAQTLSNAHVYTFPGVSHAPIDGGPCPVSIALAFLDDPTKPPDGACISKMRVTFVSEPIAERLLEPSVFHLVLGLICVLVMLLSICGWGIMAWRGRHRPAQPLRGAGLARWCAGVAVGLNLLFLVVAILSDPAQLVYGYPLALRVGMVLPLLSILPLAGALFFTMLGWKKQYWSMWVRLHYSLLTATLIVFVWQLHYWRLFGWRL